VLSNVETWTKQAPSQTEQRRPGVVDRRRSLLVGLDFSGPSHRALARAIDVARDHDAHVHVLHAVPPMTSAVGRFLRESRSLELARDELERVTAQVGSTGLPARAHFFVAGVTRALRSVASDVRADLVVVGTSGPALSSAVVGSTAERVAAVTRQPVLMVRRAVLKPYQQVIVGVTPLSDLKRLLEAARLVAPSAQQSLLHAYEDPYENALVLDGASQASLRARRVEARREARDRLMAVVTEAGLDPDEIILTNGSSRRVLDLEDREHRRNHTLFVLGRERSSVGQLLFGSVSRWLISRGECDVLLV